MTLTDWNSEFLIGSFFASVVIWLLGRIFLTRQVVYLSYKNQHVWKSIRILNRSCYCSVCEVLLHSSLGLFCECCGICCHPNCTKTAVSKFRCKERYLNSAEIIRHLWVKGNLPLDVECFVCGKDIDYQAVVGFSGYRCCWCQRIFHENCFKKFTESKNECDFGRYQSLIYPPNSIVAEKSRRTMTPHLKAINPPNWKQWKPLIVIASLKSGSSNGSDLVTLLRGFLHPSQVVEIDRKGPARALQWAIKTAPIQCRILVAGGDGSVAWVLNTISMLNINPIPEVAILPLGTGNDLARVMAWGGHAPTVIDPYKILDNILSASSVKLDRWILEVEKPRSRMPIQRSPLKTFYVYNYFSLGVDALVTLNFDEARKSPFYVWSNRLFNKMLYLIYGTKQVVTHDCKRLQERFELYIDNKLIELPKVQSIVFLNIDSWGAGVQLCELSNADSPTIKHSISDGVLEVFGIASSFHIAQLQMGICKPIRIAQGQHFRIVVKEACPVQIDGEPWIQKPCEIRLQFSNQVNMLKASTSDIQM